jgi:hypothetical protein
MERGVLEVSPAMVARSAGPSRRLMFTAEIDTAG